MPECAQSRKPMAEGSVLLEDKVQLKLQKKAGIAGLPQPAEPAEHVQFPGLTKKTTLPTLTYPAN